MPTTGEFGPGAGFGDFENHQKVATLLSAHGYYADRIGDAQTAGPATERSVAALRTLAAPRPLADALLFRVPVLYTRGNIDEAFHRALEAETTHAVLRAILRRCTLSGTQA